MSQDKNEQAKKTTLALIESINAIEGFDPMSLALQIGDLNEGGGVRYHLPVMAQIAWFRLKYPEGRIATVVKPGINCFIADARVYASYKDPVDCFLAEGSAARGALTDKPSVSPREWAQTAAVGLALRNAGFGLQCAIAGEAFESNALYELTGAGSQEIPNTGAGQTPPATIKTSEQTPAQQPEQSAPQPPAEAAPPPPPEPELTPLEKALATPCPIGKYKDKTLGDMVRMDPKALAYVANSGAKYSVEIADYAKLICESALQQATA